MVRLRLIKVFLIIVVIVVIVNLIVIAVNFSINKYKDSAVQQMRQITEEYLKEHPYADSSKPVPNIVHYVLFSIHEIQFGHFLSILSVLKNQRPKVIYVHCDCHRLSGQYWDRALKVADSVDTILVVRKIKKPTEIFDNKLSNSYMNWHASDLTRISVLKKFGGIYLDRDVYVIQPMHDLFKYELSLDFQGDVLGSQVIVSRPNARFLHLWLQSYRFYLFWEWYFNVGSLPTKGIIRQHPELVHSVGGMFGEHGPTVCPLLYNRYISDWRTRFKAVHLVIRDDEIGNIGWCFTHNNEADVIKFDEKVCLTLNNTFGEMCRDVFKFERSFSNDYI